MTNCVSRLATVLWVNVTMVTRVLLSEKYQRYWCRGTLLQIFLNIAAWTHCPYLPTSWNTVRLTCLYSDTPNVYYYSGHWDAIFILCSSFRKIRTGKFSFTILYLFLQVLFSTSQYRYQNIEISSRKYRRRRYAIHDTSIFRSCECVAMGIVASWLRRYACHRPRSTTYQLIVSVLRVWSML